MKPRIIFMGSPEFAVPALRRLVENYLVVGVVTQPDRPAGRGRSLTPPPVKAAAQGLEIPVIQPARVKAPEAMDQIQAWRPDLIVVAAFGQILRQALLDLPPLGCINVHGSLLPRWRGAAPIQAAILHGDRETGITIMQMDAGVDTGAMLSQKSLPMSPQDTAASLSQKLAELGADLLVDTLPRYLRREITPLAQDDSAATYAPMLKKEDGRLDLTQPAVALERRVRAFHPWPGAFIEWNGGILKILRARVAENTLAADKGRRPGQALVVGSLPALLTGMEILLLEEVQPAGKKSMPGELFLRGARNWEENRL